MIKKTKHSLKNFVRIAHLWLGFSSGIIVFIIAITGCIFVFQDEIKDNIYDWRFIEPQEKIFVGPATIFDTIKKKHPNSKPTMVVYHNKTRPAVVEIQIDNTPFNIHLNPFTGKIIHEQNLETDFFLVVERLHRFLLLPEKIGKQVTGIATLIFMVMLISGLILWWPKKLKGAAKHFKIKMNAKWRRKNYDWHRIIGFYLILPSTVIAITGLAFTYEWVNEGLFKIGNITNNKPTFKEPSSFKNIKSASDIALDTSLIETQNLIPESGMLFVWNRGNGEPIVTGSYPDALEFDHQSNFYFHPENGRLIATQYYNDKSPGTRLQEMNYGIHTGQYLNLFGKIMAFLTSLFIASLPVTGTLIWWGRKRKNKNKKISY
ncbi:PepSY-associated TM helix domain-containing protein [Polaribacter tangerinus]|uniref:PepSY-associated TM helix domain-containing protein n=1 Tax=Polaribacter tangerinus TaxID=1920034 RepID=UPI000B4AF709|nr:PepSY-associated TM helix domain-containing protein [Polaribacter tangerinus]